MDISPCLNFSGASNLTDITALSTFEKSPNRRNNSVTRSRNSSTSDTTISDTRSTKTKTEANLTKTPRSSINKTRQSTPKEDVFSRLSRPKSTPPVSRQTMAAPAFQNDLLLVQRNKKGTHRIQRSTIAGTPPRQSQFNRAKSMPEKNETKPLNSTKKPFTTSTATTPRTTRPTTPRTTRSTIAATPRTTRPTTPRTTRSTIATTPRTARPTTTTTSRATRSTITTTPRATRSTITTTPRATRSTITTTPRATRSTITTTPHTTQPEKRNLSSKTPRGGQTVTGSGVARESRPRPRSAILPKSASFDLDLSSKTSPETLESQVLGDKEREKLEAFEKECISNTLTLQINENNIRRQSSSDTTSELQRLLSRSSAEDNEVAMHMEQTIEKRPTLSHPPSAFSMPKPRKDKVSSHEHPTRIPTPVSFNRPLLHCKETESAPLKKQKAVDLPDTKSLLNGRVDDVFSDERALTQSNSKAPFIAKPLHNGKANSVSDEVIGDVNGETSTKPSEAIETEVQIKAKEKDEVKKETTNGAAWGFHPELRQPRFKISVDEINRLLNSSKANVEKFKSKPAPARGILTEYPQEVSTSTNPGVVTSNHAPSAFVRVDNRTNGSTKSVAPNFHHQNHSPSRHHPPTSFPGKNRHNKPHFKNSVSVDLNDNIAGYHDDKPDFTTFFQQEALKNSLLESKVKQNGLKFNQATPNNAKVYWV